MKHQNKSYILWIIVIILIISLIVVYLVRTEGFSANTASTFSPTFSPAVIGSVSQLNSNTWAFTPALNYVGSVSLQYILSDGVNTSTPYTLNLMINRVLQTITGSATSAATLIPTMSSGNFPLPINYLFTGSQLKSMVNNLMSDPNSDPTDTTGINYIAIISTSQTYLPTQNGSMTSDTGLSLLTQNPAPNSTQNPYYITGSGSFSYVSGLSQLPLTTLIPGSIYQNGPIPPSMTIPPVTSGVYPLSTNFQYNVPSSYSNDIQVTINFSLIDSSLYGQTITPGSTSLYPASPTFSITFVVPWGYQPPSVPTTIVSLGSFSQNATNIPISVQQLLGSSKPGAGTFGQLTVQNLQIMQCPAGSVVNTSGQCAQCSAGTYSSINNVCQNCFSGYWCSAGSNSPTQNLCQAGNYCPAGSSAEQLCQAGYYCPAGSSAEQLCQAGYYCPAGSAGQQICQAGNYCPIGSGAEQLCQAGNYCPAGSSAEQLCQAGYYCPAGSSAQQLCQAGYYCPVGSGAQQLCQAGYYCPAGSIGQQMCQAGYYPLLSGSNPPLPAINGGASATAQKVGIQIFGLSYSITTINSIISSFNGSNTVNAAFIEVPNTTTSSSGLYSVYNNTSNTWTGLGQITGSTVSSYTFLFPLTNLTYYLVPMSGLSIVNNSIGSSPSIFFPYGNSVPSASFTHQNWPVTIGPVSIQSSQFQISGTCQLTNNCSTVCPSSSFTVYLCAVNPSTGTILASTSSLPVIVNVNTASSWISIPSSITFTAPNTGFWLYTYVYSSLGCTSFLGYNPCPVVLSFPPGGNIQITPMN